MLTNSEALAAKIEAPHGILSDVESRRVVR